MQFLGALREDDEDDERQRAIESEIFRKQYALNVAEVMSREIEVQRQSRDESHPELAAQIHAEGTEVREPNDSTRSCYWCFFTPWMPQACDRRHGNDHYYMSGLSCSEEHFVRAAALEIFESFVDVIEARLSVVRRHGQSVFEFFITIDAGSLKVFKAP